MISEKEIARRLNEGQISLPPAIFQVADRETNTGAGRVDTIIWISWGEQREEFAVEFKAMWTPKIIREAMYRVKAAAQDMRLNPMIIVPYLNEERLRELERENVSGVDLCGNGVVIVPEKLFIFRTGNPNQFPSSAPIKNIYRRNSSMVGRDLTRGETPRFGSWEKAPPFYRPCLWSTGTMPSERTSSTPNTFPLTQRTLRTVTFRYRS